MSNITRRDFVNGFALSLAAGTSLPPAEAVAQGLLSKRALGGGSDTYPPAMTGMRGTTNEVMYAGHSATWLKRERPVPAAQTDATYDLIVVGGGISGLSAAWYFRQGAGPDARILILENHDDFGGHARRNQFLVDGRTVVCPGGAEFLHAANHFPKPAHDLIEGLWVDLERLHASMDQEFALRHGLAAAIFWDEIDSNGARLESDAFGSNFYGQKTAPISSQELRAAIARLPLSEKGQAQYLALLTQERPIYPGLSEEEREHRLRTTPYADYLRDECEASEEVVQHIIATSHSFTAIKGDIAPAAFFDGGPGLVGRINNYGLNVGDYRGPVKIFDHAFPDGNASLARLMVRSLIPSAAPGNTMDDIVLAPFDYSRLDVESSPTRLRLDSTVFDVRHAQDRNTVDVSYLRKDATHRVRGRHVILACWHGVIPHICSEVGGRQAKALSWGERYALVYINVCLRNWRPLVRSGYGSAKIHGGNSLISSVAPFAPVSMGGYQYATSPDDPLVLRCSVRPTSQDVNLSGRERFRAGRRSLMGLSFDDYERETLRVLKGIWGEHGLDPNTMIAGITVNRWPHGVGYTYNPIQDAQQWGDTNGHYAVATQQLHRISISSTDAGGGGAAQEGFVASHNAVREQLSING